jgi:hypothetical protein
MHTDTLIKGAVLVQVELHVRLTFLRLIKNKRRREKKTKGLDFSFIKFCKDQIRIISCLNQPKKHTFTPTGAFIIWCSCIGWPLKSERNQNSENLPVLNYVAPCTSRRQVTRGLKNLHCCRRRGCCAPYLITL